MAEEKLYSVLKDRFGFDEFRGLQKPVIQRALEGKDSLVIMPTGMGKSLCYQLPSELLPGLTLVISPLIALMKDQVDAARKKGLKATFINSSLTASEREQRMRELSEQKYRLLYVTPERFRKKEFWQALAPNQISLLAIDEAHCISQWGHDFRPDYTRIAEIRERLGAETQTLKPPPVMALTATATTDVQHDIVKQMGSLPESCESFLFGVERPNLQLDIEEVHGLDQKVQMYMALRHQHPGPAIVYFSLISTLESFSHELQKLGIEHLKYHGQLDNRRRKQQQRLFLQSDSDVILATPAFGLGVDKPNIRMIVHAEIPGSIEAYYQEVGRSGRDGEPANCYLLYDQDDVTIQMDFIKWGNPEPSFIHSVFEQIKRHPERVEQEGLDYLRGQLNFYNRRDFRVETAVNLLQRWDSVAISDDRRKSLKALAEPPAEYLDEEAARQRLKRQNENLLEIVNYVKTEGDRKQFIYDYFGVNEPHSQEDLST